VRSEQVFFAGGPQPPGGVFKKKTVGGVLAQINAGGKNPRCLWGNAYGIQTKNRGARLRGEGVGKKKKKTGLVGRGNPPQGPGRKGKKKAPPRAGPGPR